MSSWGDSRPYDWDQDEWEWEPVDIDDGLGHFTTEMLDKCDAFQNDITVGEFNQAMNVIAYVAIALAVVVAVGVVFISQVTWLP